MEQPKRGRYKEIAFQVAVDDSKYLGRAPAAPDFVDHPFGYFSIAGIATVPLGGTTSYGAWNVHGGVEYLRLGETTQAFNGGDANRVVGSIGVGFSY